MEWQDNITGKCPVKGNVRVEVEFNNGETNDGYIAGDWHWIKNNDAYSIKRWRPVE